MQSIQREELNLVYPFQGAGTCDSFLHNVPDCVLVKISHWLMHGDLEMLMGILKLKAFPSICLAFTCALWLPWQSSSYQCPVDISGTVVGESPDSLLLSGTVVSENQDHVCWLLTTFWPPCIFLCIHVQLQIPIWSINACTEIHWLIIHISWEE